MHVAQVLLVFMKPMAKSVVSTLVSPASLTIVTCICTPQARLRSLQSRLSLIVITSFNSGIEAVRKLSTLWQHLVMHDYRVPAEYMTLCAPCNLSRQSCSGSTGRSSLEAAVM